jgi:hypothetical protein
LDSGSTSKSSLSLSILLGLILFWM